MPNTRTIIASLSEDDLRVKVLIPLFRSLGCIKVEDWHGSLENGIDIYFAYKDVLGSPHHCAVFIKAGDITKSGTRDIRKYEGQLREAFHGKFTNPLDTSSKASAGLVYVACNGVMNKAAKDYFREALENQNPGRIRILDIDEICYLVNIELPGRPDWPPDYVFEVESFVEVCSKFQPKPYTFLTGPKEGASL